MASPVQGTAGEPISPVIAERLQRSFDSAAVGMAITGPGGRFLQVNPAVCSMLGYTQEEMTSGSFMAITHPDDVAESRAFLERLVQGEIDAAQWEKRYIHRDGHVVWVQITTSMVRDEQHHPLYSTTQLVDIGARVAAEEALRRSEARYRGIIETTRDGIWQTDALGSTTYVNARMADLLGCTVEEMLGRPLLDFLPADARETVRAHQQRRAEAGDRHENLLNCFDLQLEHRDGSKWWGMLSATSLFDDAGAYVGSWAMVSDITARKNAEDELRHQALHDTLTGLPNRTLFLDRLEQALAGQTRRAGAVALLFLDLDRFKVINDSLGHEAGDRLLVTVATRVKNCLRAGDTVARMGGDELAVLLNEIGNADKAVRVAKKILAALDRPCRLAGHDVVATTSIGIVISTPAQSAADLMREADIALYRAKAAGRGRYELFDATMAARALERLQLEAELRQALERGEFEVYYQPKIDFANGALAGMEALVRWRHPTRGIVAPDTFIPLAEETGLICPLGQWVLEESCRQTSAWNEREGAERMVVSVNLSARQFAQPTLVSDVDRALRSSGVEPGDIQLEITESTAMGDAPATVETLNQLKALGVQLAIDDFGTGYSSLAYLRRFPIDVLKIDRAFVSSLHSSDEDASIVDAVVSLGHALKLSVVGEGVETEKEARQLAELGCDLGQGYYFARPLTRAGADQFVEHARERSRGTRSGGQIASIYTPATQTMGGPQSLPPRSAGDCALTPEAQQANRR